MSNFFKIYALLSQFLHVGSEVSAFQNIHPELVKIGCTILRSRSRFRFDEKDCPSVKLFVCWTTCWLFRITLYKRASWIYVFLHINHLCSIWVCLQKIVIHFGKYDNSTFTFSFMALRASSPIFPHFKICLNSHDKIL